MVAVYREWIVLLVLESLKFAHTKIQRLHISDNTSVYKYL